MIIKCAVVDDNFDDLNLINKTIKHLSSQTKNEFDIHLFSSSKQFNYFCLFDLYILDIDLPEESGFTVASKIYKNHPDATIVFCTCHDNFVFDSFKLRPFYFVRKSLLKDDLTIALRKFIQYFEDEHSEYVINNTDRVCRIPYEKILYFETIRNDLFVHTKEKEYRERKTLKQLITEVPNLRFIQVSQSYVVNAAHIAEIIENEVVLDNEKRINIPRRNIQTIMQKYMLYVTR